MGCGMILEGVEIQNKIRLGIDTLIRWNLNEVEKDIHPNGVNDNNLERLPWNTVLSPAVPPTVLEL